MRPIKFRFRSVWWMHEVVEIDFKNQKVWLSDGDQRDIASGVLMQSTGVYDKNWVEIYEGDVVAGERQQFIHLEPCVVFYDQFKLWFYAKLARLWEPGFCWKTGSGREYMVERKHKVVLGNIYENPELLNQ